MPLYIAQSEDLDKCYRCLNGLTQIVKTHQIVDAHVELVPISSFSFWGAFHRCTVDQTIHLRIRALIEIYQRRIDNQIFNLKQ